MASPLKTTGFYKASLTALTANLS